MREIALDTETTGFDPKAGHRIVEIGCVELNNHMPTGRHFHRYLNPERDMPPEAMAVHGLSAERLAGEPVFAAIAADFLDFIGDATLVIHNADFDVGFLNAELGLLGFPPIGRGRVIDTMALTRRKLPGQALSLDALCQRFGVNNSHRTLHGALLDAQLLASVYLELVGGRQAQIALSSTGTAVDPRARRTARPPRPHAPSAAEAEAHAALLQRLKAPLWTRME